MLVELHDSMNKRIPRGIIDAKETIKQPLNHLKQMELSDAWTDFNDTYLVVIDKCLVESVYIYNRNRKQKKILVF